MACEKCNGYWACSIDEDPCSVRFDRDPIDTQEHCLRIFTKKTGAGCQMMIKLDGGPDQGWDDAGELCFTFQLFMNDNGECVVKVDGPTT
jgi:hypothetical protein